MFLLLPEHHYDHGRGQTVREQTEAQRDNWTVPKNNLAGRMSGGSYDNDGDNNVSITRHREEEKKEGGLQRLGLH